MKIILSILLCLLLTACGGNEKNQQNTSTLQTETQAEIINKDPSVDVDLTALSSTMVYAEVYNMMTAPEDYIGKTVKMTGSFIVYTDPNTGKNYYSCIITDALACCSQGIEFVLSGEYNYPEDYPEIESEITVKGEFQTYEEEGYYYLNLINASLE